MTASTTVPMVLGSVDSPSDSHIAAPSKMAKPTSLATRPNVSAGCLEAPASRIATPVAAISSPMRFAPDVVAKPARAIAPPRDTPIRGSAGRSRSAVGTAATMAASPIPCCREDASTPLSGARNATQTRTLNASSSPTIAQRRSGAELERLFEVNSVEEPLMGTSTFSWG